MLLEALSIVLHIIICCWALQDDYSIIINSRNGSCPPWYYHDDEDKCSFSHQLPQIVNQYGNTSELEMGYCMTQTNSSLVVSRCPYIPTTHNFSQYHSIYQVLPKQLNQVNDSLCGTFNRKGFLCSECKENYGLAAYRYYGLMCVKCSDSAWNWVAYILLLFVPPTILFMVLLVVNINVHSGALTGFIFFVHTVTSTVFFFPAIVTLPKSLFGYWPMHSLSGFYGIWTIDFIQFVVPPFCVSTSLTTLQLVSLGYVSSVYSLLLCMATYYMIELHARGNWLLVKIWWPFHRFFFKYSNYSKIQSSVIHAMATFILLSYGKNVFVSVTLFQGNTLVELDISMDTSESLPPRSVDLGVPYFGATHAPYAALGILGCLITILLPLVLVIIYPTRVFPKLIRCFGLRRWHAVRAFLEVFVGSYKDGTNASEGKRDYRLFAALYFIGRILTGVCFTVSNQTSQQYNWMILAVPFLVVAVVIAYIKPHRKWYHNLVDVLLFLLLSKICVCMHIIFETSINDDTLRVLVLIIMIEMAIPQLVVFIYFFFKFASWGYLQHLKQLSKNCTKSGSDEDEMETLLQFQESPSESQPLLQ